MFPLTMQKAPGSLPDAFAHLLYHFPAAWDKTGAFPGNVLNWLE